MLRIYKIGSLTYQYEEGEQPAGAVLVDDTKPAEKKAPAKARTSANKSKAAANK